MKHSLSLRRALALLLTLCLLSGLVSMTGICATAPARSAQSEDSNWCIPTLSDTTLRAGRSSIKTTANNWQKYLSVSEAGCGLRFCFTSAIGTVFEGLQRRMDLNGLCLKFSDLEYTSVGSAPFAVSFGRGDYDRFAFGLIFDLYNGKIFVGQANGSTLSEHGEAIMQDPALRAENLEGKAWTLSLSKEIDGSYRLTITVDAQSLCANIAQALVENDSYDSTSCCMSIMAIRNLPSFSLTLAGWKQLPAEHFLCMDDTMLYATGNYSETLDTWAKWLTVTDQTPGGLHYDFTAAAHSVAEGFTIPVSLEGVRFRFSNLQTADPTKSGRLCLSFGSGALIRSSFGLIFDFANGRVYASNPELSNGTQSTSRVYAVGEPLFSGNTFAYANMQGKEWYVDFALQEDGSCEVAVVIDDERHCATVDASVVRAYADFDPTHCYAYLMSAQGNTTLSLDLLSMTRTVAPPCIDNSDLMPTYVPSDKVSVDANGTPTWLSSATIVEVNIPRATKDGTLESAVSVLDHLQEMGVNCIWLTSVGEPGTKNDGSAGNHYVNLGLQSIDPAITETTDYEQGWQRFAEFVEQAHARNIYVIFNVITWGTTSDSPIYKQHPQWYTGEETWGGKAWDWSNDELVSWYTETLLDIIQKTNIDGIFYDCEPQYASYDVCSQIRKKVQDSGRNLVYISENVNSRSDAFDLELYGVMNYRNHTETWLAIGEYQKDDKEFFVDEGFNLVDCVKEGTLSGTKAEQESGTGGTHKYYTYSFSNHDSYYFFFNKNILDVAYQGIFSSYIPLWSLGDEFNSTPSGVRVYFDDVKWNVLATTENAAFYEEVKQMLRIRREYGYVFDQAASNHRNTNICKVSATGALDLQAYARYADNTAIIVAGNHNADGKAVTTTVTIPFEEAALSKYDRFTVTDLLSGEVLCRGSKAEVESFTVTLPYDKLGVYAVIGVGTANEGLTVAKMSHALLRNGTAHQNNTVTNNWASYVQVTEAPLGNGLRFSFTNAVTTTGEGINAPVSLEDLYLQLDSLQGFVNNGSSSDPSRIALSFGPGGYERNSFGLIFDFANGAIYAGKQTAGTTDRLTTDSAPLIKAPELQAAQLSRKQWAIQFTKNADGNYTLRIEIDDAVYSAQIDASYIVKTDTFDPTSCYLYFTAAGAKPTLSFDLVGWRSAGETLPYFGSKAVLKQRGNLSLADDTRNRGLQIDFCSTLPLTGVQLRQNFNLDGTTFYFDDLSNYRNYSPASGSTKYALTFTSEGSEDTAFGIIHDLKNGKINLCLNGCTERELLSHSGLTYNHFRDVRWSISLVKNQNDTFTLTVTLPDGTYSADITGEELAQARGFRPDACRLNIIAWDGPLELSLRAVGYQTHTWDVNGDGIVDPSVNGHTPVYIDNGDKTHTVACADCDFSEILECSFEKGECICGAKEIAEPIYDDAVKFSHSLTLENDISINFIGIGSALSVYDSFYLECKVPVYSGNELTGYEIVNIEPVYNGKNYEFTLLGVTAKMMNDDIEAVFRMTKDGKEYYSKTDVYSVAEYAYGKLDSTKATDTDELKAICANLLRYGALAQTQFNYRTDALVDANMTDAHKAYLTDLITVEMKDYRKQLNDLDTVIVPWRSTTLELGNKVIMCLIVNLSNYTGDPSELTMRLTFTDNNGAVITEERPLELYNPDALTYAVSYDGLRATEMRSIVNAAIYNGDTRVSKTVEYSIESYGARSSDAAMRELCLAMLAYGDAANTFFSK